MHIDTTTGSFLGVPPYLFFAGLGLVAAIGVYLLLLPGRRICVQTQTTRLLLALTAILPGAKILGAVGAALFALEQGRRITVSTLLSGGIAFYGGLFGLLGAYLLLGKCRKIGDDASARDALAVVIPLFHAFGRVGCFFSGCCYGMEYHGAGAVFYRSQIDGAVVTVQRLPVQLLEASGNLVLFILLLVCYLRGKRGLLARYLPAYACLRFATELLRGDALRGVAFGLSVSQYVSMIVLVIAAARSLLRGAAATKIQKGKKQNG